MVVQWLLVALLTHLPGAPRASPNHDDLQWRSPTYTANQRYGANEGRRLESVGPETCPEVHTKSWDYIRIGFEVLDVDGTAVSQLTLGSGHEADMAYVRLVRDILMPRAVEYLKRALSVRRASAPLRADRGGSGCSKYHSFRLEFKP